MPHKSKKKTFIRLWLDELDKINISKIFINTHYKSEMVHSYVRKHKSFNKIKILNEKKLLGTAGSLFNNVKLFKEDSMLMIHADNYSKFNISNLINAHNSRPKQCLMTMMVFNSPNPKTCGIVEIDKNKIVKSFVEKPKKPLSNLANCAVYVLSKKFF
jgi:mannose-1-phosphate guanylyltransferase